MNITNNEQYWQRLDELVVACGIVIDRPRSTPHPRYPDFIYPYDYGYLADTQAMDGGGIDVWRGTMPGESVTGMICTVDGQKKDAEMKILVGCTAQEAQEILKTHNDGAQAAILILR